MTIQREMRKLSELRNWKDNPRSIKAKDFERLKKQIQKLGQYKPLLVTLDGEVIGGNMRLRAYQELGVQDVWVSVVTPKDENEKLEYALSDNDRVGFYDEDLLANLVPNYNIEWKDYAIDLREPITLEGLIEKFSPTEEDEAPALVDREPESKPGQLFVLGKHRLLCGDSTKVEDVSRLMDKQVADMVFTEPPYNINYKGSGKNTSNKIANDHMSDANFAQFLRDTFARYREIVKDGAGLYVFHSASTQDQFKEAIEDAGFIIKNQLIWNKPSASLGWGDYRYKHEPFFYCGINGSETVFYGDRTNSTIWDFHKRPEDLIKWAKRELESERNGKSTIWSMSRDNVIGYVHPTQKPVILIKTALLNSSKAGDIVVDLFGGSGSTLIACEQTNRACYMMELDPKYCDVIRKRYYKFIGKEDKWQIQAGQQ